MNKEKYFEGIIKRNIEHPKAIMLMHKIDKGIPFNDPDIKTIRKMSKSPNFLVNNSIVETAEYILKEVAKYTGTSIMKMRTKNRRNQKVEARYLFFALCNYFLTGYDSKTNIINLSASRVFLDKGSVYAGLRRVQNDNILQAKFKDLVEIIEREKVCLN